MKTTLTKMAGGFVLLTGIGHTTTHLMLLLSGSTDPFLKQAMQAHKVNVLGERSLLDYHQGFSLAMGILLMGLGVQILQLHKVHNQPSRLNLLLTTALISGVSVIYFHPIAIGLMSLSFLFLLISNFNKYAN